MKKEYWFCKSCGHYEEIGKDRADVIMGLCPKCYHFMTRQLWEEEHIEWLTSRKNNKKIRRK